MKFANLVLGRNKDIENLGHWMQIVAIENLYRYMNINYSDVVRISISDLNTYNGEYLILPINFPFYGFYNLSPKIIPVFLGISVISGNVAQGLRMWQYQPIGCRDYHSFLELKKQGLEVYYGGCLTITFPKRDDSIKGRKIFIVDVSKKIIDRLPDNITRNAEYISQIVYGKNNGGEKRAREIYERYIKEGALVITSRIHCAQPCLAAGIPVIFICERVSFRYEVLRQYIPIYTLDSLQNIDWNPQPVKLESVKKKLLENAKHRIIDVSDKYKSICDISDFFLANAESLKYDVDSVWAFKEYVEKRWKYDDEFTYILWGRTQIADFFYSWMKKKYKNATLDSIIDIFSKEAFYRYDPVDEKVLAEKKDTVVFVTAGAANIMALETFKKYDIKHFVICYNGMYIVDGIEKEY